MINIFNDLLIVFSNYNGMRMSCDLENVRIYLTIDSFKKQVGYWADLNALLLDNNSTDGSDELLKSFETRKWKFEKKVVEDYYLGTLRKLLKKYSGQYKFLMVIDNDQYFIRPNFLETVISIFSNNKEIVCMQMNETTILDSLDSNKKQNRDLSLAGFFDKIGVENGEIWLRSYDFSHPMKELKPRKKEKGVGQVCLPGRPPKRICWGWFGYSCVMMRINEIVPIFDNPIFSPPFKGNPDRLALFSSCVRDVGRTGFLGRGASINIGPRKYLDPSFSIKSLIQEYSSQHHKSRLLDDDYSFFVKNGSFCSIEKQINKILKKRKYIYG